MNHNNLWPHQEHVFNLLMKGQNVILQTPTGSGKTRAALYPWLRSKDRLDATFRDKLPPKCIYSVPMRVLARQFFHEYDDIIARYNLNFGLKISRSIQTGEQPEDRQFASDLIFATIDQTLSSFLIAPYSLPKRLANLNAGAVASSYLVFDEFHLFDPKSTLPTTLQMLQMLKGIVPFVLMTATFSAHLLNDLAVQLDAVVVPAPGGDQDLRAALLGLPSQDKQRRYYVADGHMSAEGILEKHTGRSLVICNRVDHAMRVYRELQEQAHNTEVLLLHSRFLSEDRRATEDRIRELFGKRKNGAPYEGSAIVVATQAIEVGVDITSTVLHTELAPANAIIQRAGRCARYQGDSGDVYIYPQARKLEDGELKMIDLTEDVLPYIGQTTTLCRTLDAFREKDGQFLNYEGEQWVLEQAHGEDDRSLIEQLRQGELNHRRSMYAVMEGRDSYDARHLIREVVSQRVTVHADPDTALIEAPFDAPAFSLHPGTVRKYAEDWIERGNALNLDWSLKVLHDHGEQADSRDERLEFKRVNEAKAAVHNPLLVVHPALGTYDPVVGFIADHGGEWQAELPKRDKRQAHPTRRYTLETYERHIELVYDAFRRFWPEAAYAATQLERRSGWSEGSIRQAAELAVLLHDVGKLTVGWQKWAHAYQQAVFDHVLKTEDEMRAELEPHPDEAYAHTTVDGDRYRELEQTVKPSRPRHAVEGAVASYPTIEQRLGRGHALARSVFTAIACHHSPHVTQALSVTLRHDAVRHAQQVFANGTPDVRLKDADSQRASKHLNHLRIEADTPKTAGSYLAYLLIVRALRRADQSGTEAGSRLDV